MSKYKSFEQHKNDARETGFSTQVYEEGFLTCVVSPHNREKFEWFWNSIAISDYTAHGWICGADIPMPVR